MGNCIETDKHYNNELYLTKYLKRTNSLKNIKQKFIKYNQIDTNIIIGIFNNPDKSNTLGNQGIWIGQDDKIYSLNLGIYHKCYDFVLLTFENGIKLKISKKDKITWTLETNNNSITREFDVNTIKNLKKINSDSLDLDLIFYILN